MTNHTLKQNLRLKIKKNKDEIFLLLTSDKVNWKGISILAKVNGKYQSDIDKLN